jgi:hypothetical protein
MRNEVLKEINEAKVARARCMKIYVGLKNALNKYRHKKNKAACRDTSRGRKVNVMPIAL